MSDHLLRIAVSLFFVRQEENICVCVMWFLLVMSLRKKKRNMSDALPSWTNDFLHYKKSPRTNFPYLVLSLSFSYWSYFLLFSCVSDVTLMRIGVKLPHCEVRASSLPQLQCFLLFVAITCVFLLLFCLSPIFNFSCSVYFFFLFPCFFW